MVGRYSEPASKSREGCAGRPTVVEDVAVRLEDRVDLMRDEE